MWALLTDNVVREITDIDPSGRYHPDLLWVPVPEGVGVGWVLVEGEWSPPVLEVPAPQVTMMQAKMTLAMAGLLEGAQDVIYSMEGVDGELARIQWENATIVRRDWPLLQQVAEQISLTDEEIDGLFAFAQTIG